MKISHQLILLTFLIFVLSCEDDYTTNDKDLIEFVPPKTALVLRSDNFLELKEELHELDWLRQNSKKKLLKEWGEKLKLIENWPIQQAGFLSFTPIGKKQMAISFITKSDTAKEIPLSSGEVLKRFDYNGQQIREVELKQDTYFMTRFQNVVHFSSSQLIIENSIRNIAGDLPANPGLLRTSKSTNDEMAVFLNFDRKEELFNHWLPDYVIDDVEGFNNWIGLDVDMDDYGILLNGIIDREVERQLSAFDPGKRHGVNVIPANTLTYLSMNYPGIGKDNENQRRFPDHYDLIKHTDEFFKVRTISSVLYGFHLKDAKKAFAILDDISQEHSIFRDKQIYELAKKDLLKNMGSIDTKKVNYFTQIEDVLLLSDEMSGIKNMIISYHNNSLLKATPYLNMLDVNLTEEQNYFGLINFEELAKNPSGLILPDLFSKIKELDLSGSKIMGFQINEQDDINYLSTYIPQDKGSDVTANPSQINRITIDRPVVKRPTFFVNWRTQQRDLVFQDDENKLYLFDTKGNLIWEKQLDSRVVGKLHTIDIYKNTRKQLSFTTQNKLYLIDKNGNDVAPFPKTFDNIITRGLSIFDYANTGRYRFIIVQDEKVSFYDRELKKVKGFDFQPVSQLKNSLKHIRIGRKDFIIAEYGENKAKILNRRGKERVEPEDDIDFSHNGIFEYNDKFMTTSKQGSMIKIDQEGKMEKRALASSDEHLFIASHQNWAMIDENRLIINNNERELDYGLYTKPQIHQLNERVLISFTDTQAGKIYLFNDQAELLPGFPIYGKTAIDLYENAQNELVFTCLGEEDAVLVYKL
jgi:hypothetical protein